MTTLFEAFHFRDEGAFDYGDWPYGIEDLVLLSDHRFVIGLPYNSPAELRRYVFAAAKAYYLDNKSIDWVLKRYSAAWGSFGHPSSRSQFVRKMTGDVKAHTRNILKPVRVALGKPDHIGMFASWAALVRLQTTFRTAIFATHNGFHFEASSLSRMILEQIAWVYSIYKINDESLFKVEPPSCIRKLKNLFPNAGPLYGHLSENAHVSPMNTLQYIQSKEGQLSIQLTSDSESELDALILLTLADMYVVLVEIIFADFLKSFVYTKRVKDAGRIPKKSRPTQQLIKNYYKTIADRAAKRAKKVSQ